MKTYQTITFFALAALISDCAFAGAPVPPSSATASVTSTAPAPVSQVPELLANEQAQTALLTAKATNARLRADIKQSERSSNASATDAGASPAGGLAGLNQPLTKLRKDEGDEELLSVGGADGAYRAFLSVSGRTIIAEVGDTIDNGWKVVSISGSTVQLSKGKQQRTLRI